MVFLNLSKLVTFVTSQMLTQTIHPFTLVTAYFRFLCTGLDIKDMFLLQGFTSQVWIHNRSCSATAELYRLFFFVIKAGEL